MEVSNLAFIANPPANPMDLFATWHNEAKQFSDPIHFADTMTIASLSDEDELLNRNVIRRGHDANGIVFVTERNCKKYKDLMKSPTVAVVFLWMHMLNGAPITRQVRVIGDVSELSESEIAEYYKQEPLFAKIRSKICRCGEEVNWDELKAKHDQVLKDYKEGRDNLPQLANYTAMRITPRKMDFYFTHIHEIADRVKYTLDGDKWTKCHVAA